MINPYLRRCGRGERGVTLILFALVAVLLFVISALVVDLSFVRQNRQDGKSASDFAVAAGIRSLDNGSGEVQPWLGICVARDFLLANSPEFAGMTYVDASGNLITDPCLSPPTTICDPASSATWGTLRGLADSGRLRVTISNGYDLSGSSFSEDDDAYSGDEGTDPCEHLALIVEEGEKATFGGMAGFSGYETKIRSVARLSKGEEGEVAAALILLERHNCDVIRAAGGGSENAGVEVSGHGTSPGIIHADSLGDGCSGVLFNVNGSAPPPRIVARRAALVDPETGVRASGEISAVAKNGPPGVAARTDSVGVDRVCAQVAATDCALAGGGSQPVGRELVGRGRVDRRYRSTISSLHADAEIRFGWTSEQAEDNGFVVKTCDDPGPFTDAKIWIGVCPTAGGAFNGNNKRFESSVKEVVINTSLTLSGSSSTLDFRAPDRVFIRGQVSLGSQTITVNANGAANCAARYSGAPTARTQFVVGEGGLRLTGGQLRMCQTTALLYSPGAVCGVATSDGTAPIPPNSCTGVISSNNASIDWTAPNQNNVTSPTAAQLAQLEDLALWSESTSSWSIGGNPDLVKLGGIFFTPNADPFAIGGRGTWDIAAAQFLTRRLALNGNGVLTMSPEAINSVTIPRIGGFTLIR